MVAGGPDIPVAPGCCFAARLAEMMPEPNHPMEGEARCARAMSQVWGCCQFSSSAEIDSPPVAVTVLL